MPGRDELSAAGVQVDLIPLALTRTVTRARTVAPLYRYLRERGISQAWLARRLEMRQQTLNNVFRGACQPPMPLDEFRERAADALGVPVVRIWTPGSGASAAATSGRRTRQQAS